MGQARGRQVLGRASSRTSWSKDSRPVFKTRDSAETRGSFCEEKAGEGGEVSGLGTRAVLRNPWPLSRRGWTEGREAPALGAGLGWGVVWLLSAAPAAPRTQQALGGTEVQKAWITGRQELGSGLLVVRKQGVPDSWVGTAPGVEGHGTWSRRSLGRKRRKAFPEVLM